MKQRRYRSRSSSSILWFMPATFTLSLSKGERGGAQQPARLRLVSVAAVSAMALTFSIDLVSKADASCGSTACFIVTGSEGVQLKNSLTIDLSYSYTPATVPDGESGLVAAVVDQEPGSPPLIILNEHRERVTRTQVVTLNMNYGLTNNLTLQLQVPYRNILHKHDISLGLANRGAGVFEKFQDAGVGDIFIGGKYSVLPTLRSMLVLGFGLFLPSGDFNEVGIEGVRQEPTLQIGRGSVGILPSIYQSYEVIPHVLNQFATFSYRHQFRPPDSYQFGDEFTFSGGLNWKVLERVTVSGQLNYKLTLKDSFEAVLARVPVRGEPQFGRELVILDPEVKRHTIPTTGSTIFAFSPGLTVDITERLAAYFFVQVPITKDFNGALAQDTSFLGGIRMRLD